MQLQEIPQADWQRFAAGFREQHRGWLSNLELQRAGHDRSIEGHDLALEGFQVLQAQDGTPIVRCVVRPAGTEHPFEVTVARPRTIALVTTDEGAHAGLEVQLEGDMRLRLRFRVAARPEMVNGLAL